PALFMKKLQLSSSFAGPISYHPTINYYDFRTTLGDDIISNVLNIVQSDIPTVVNYYDFREDDNGILSLSNVLKYIHGLTDVYYYRYDSESGDSIFLGHITVHEQPVNHIIVFGERAPISGRENGHTFHQCNICMKKSRSPDFWRQHFFKKDGCIKGAQYISIGCLINSMYLFRIG
ncbi:14049_t:CDS:2, partial [Gigaspora rosea]